MKIIRHHTTRMIKNSTYFVFGFFDLASVLPEILRSYILRSYLNKQKTNQISKKF